MAVVDPEFRDWLAAFKEVNPVFAEKTAILDAVQYAFTAGRRAERARHEGMVHVDADSVGMCECGCQRHYCLSCGHDIGGPADSPQGVKDV